MALLSASLRLHASFIESTLGTAVVNDATATYHNPAALTLLTSPQLIALGSTASFHASFNGHTYSYLNGTTQPGSSKDKAQYQLPSLYMAIPIRHKLNIGLAILSNTLNSGVDDTSILRYVKTGKQLSDVDFVPGIGVELTDYLSVGGGFNYSYARYVSNPVTGFPSLDIPDSQSHNTSNAYSYGENVGFVLKPAASTLIGFNYRTSMRYPFHGTSAFRGPPELLSNDYHFHFWTPARSVFTISHFITPEVGVLTTIQRVQWHIFQKVIVHGAATEVGSHAMILPTAVVNYHFHDTWIMTLGGIKRVTPQWVVRIAGTYEQSPGNGHYQVIDGDKMTIGASTEYKFTQHMKVDASYSHMFVKQQGIDLISKNSIISGVNKGYGDAVSLKLTLTA